jgi:hypothetical protein
MTSTQLYDKACIAAEKARALRTKFKTKGLSVPDELYWYNNNTNWNALSRKEFRDIMIRMESVTAQHYEDFGADHYRSAAIRKFWADEWGCEYLPETGQWFDLVSNNIFISQTEKAQAKAEKKAKKAEKKAKKALEKAKKAAKQEKQENQEKQEKQEQGQYNDEEEELYRQAQQQQEQQQQQQQQPQPQPQPQPHDYDYYDWCYDEAEEAYAEAYAKAKQQQEKQEQQEAEAYLSDNQDQEQDQHQLQRIACQPVFYFEELTNVKGDPDWRAFIYYDDDIRRYVFKGTRRSLRATNRKTRYPEVKLCFCSSRELASFLCSSTDNKLNVTMFAMTTATVKEATFADLYALPVRGDKTELFGYDDTCPSYRTFVDYLRMLSDVDVAQSDFANFLAY